MTNINDAVYMAHALKLAHKGRFTTSPNPNVGCVIVRDGMIVGEGYHIRTGGPHAEIYALRQAGDKAQGATAYVTLEPCSHHGKTPPCCEALIQAGIKRVVAAMQDPNPQVAGRGMYRLQQAGIVIHSGLMQDEAEALNPGFLKRMRTGLPYVRLKLASSLDGRTAMSSGESQWITSAQAREDVQRFRAESSAILSSSATVLADNPSLTVRWKALGPEIQSIYSEADIRQPIRVIVDSQNRVTPQHRLLHEEGMTWLARAVRDEQNWPDSCEQIILPSTQQGIDLVALMVALGKRQINCVWTEAGAGLAGALLQTGLVDELILYMAPRLLGDSPFGLCQLPGIQTLAGAPAFSIKDVRQVGPDLRLRLCCV